MGLMNKNSRLQRTRIQGCKNTIHGCKRQKFKIVMIENMMMLGTRIQDCIEQEYIGVRNKNSRL